MSEDRNNETNDAQSAASDSIKEDLTEPFELDGAATIEPVIPLDQELKKAEAQAAVYRAELMAKAEQEVKEHTLKLMEQSLKGEETEKKVQETKRVEKGTQTVWHDLFKLLPEKVIKNIGWDPKNPVLQGHDHIHYFHSVDSAGRPQGYCAPQAGHIHKVKWGEDEAGNLVIKEVGPAVLAISAKRKKDYPYDQTGLLNDRHNHKGEYVLSESVQVRTRNAKAAEQMAARAAEEKATATNFAKANV